MKKCKMCGTEIYDGLKNCPNCHFKLSSENSINILTKATKGYFIFVIIFSVIIFTGVIAVFIGMNNKMNSYFPNSINNVDNNDAYLDNIKLLTGNKIVKDDFYYLEGILKNNNNIDIDNIKVTFTIYDETGALLDTIDARIALIETNGTWKFKIPCGIKEPSSFKLKKIEFY